MVKPQLVQEYVTEGQVLFEYRNFPILGNESWDAAHASMCAADQGMFWEYHDLLFYNQGEQSNNGAFARERLDRIAERAGLDTEQFDQCMDDRQFEDEVQRQFDNASSRGVAQTPTVMVNGELIDNFTGYDSLRTRIEQALAEGQGSN